MITELILKVESQGLNEADNLLSKIENSAKDTLLGVSKVNDVFIKLSQNISKTLNNYMRLEKRIDSLNATLHVAVNTTKKLIDLNEALNFDNVANKFGKTEAITKNVKDLGFQARVSGILLKGLAGGAPAVKAGLSEMSVSVTAFDSALKELKKTGDSLVLMLTRLDKLSSRFGRNIRGYDKFGAKLEENSDNSAPTTAGNKGKNQTEKHVELKVKGDTEAKAKIDKVTNSVDKLANRTAIANSAFAKTGEQGKFNLGKVLESFEKFKGASTSPLEAVKGLASGLGGVGKVALGLGVATAGIAAIGYAVVKVFQATSQATQAMLEFAQAGAKIKSVKDSFKILGGTDTDLAEVRRATKGVVDELTLYTIANVGKFNKLSTDNAAKIAKVAVGASTATGQSIKEAYERLTLAIVKGEAELLDEYGIKLKSLDVLKKEYAKAKGKTVEQLSAQDTQDLFAEAVFKAGSKQLELGSKVAADPLQQFATMRKNLEDGMLETFSKIFVQSGALTILTDTVKTVQETFAQLTSGDGAGFIRDIVTSFSESFKIILNFIVQLLPSIQLVLQVFNLIAPAINGIVSIVGTLLNVFVHLIKIGAVPFVQIINLAVEGLVEIGKTLDLDTSSLERINKNLTGFVESVKEQSKIIDKSKDGVSIPISFEFADKDSAAWAFATLSDEELAKWKAEQQKLADSMRNESLFKEGIRQSFDNVKSYAFQEAPIMSLAVSEAMSRELFSAMGASLEAVPKAQVLQAAKEFSDEATKAVTLYMEQSVKGSIERELRSALGADDATYNALFDDLAKVKGDAVKENEVYLRMATVVEQRSVEGSARIAKALQEYERVKSDPSKITFKDLKGISLDFAKLEKTLGTTFSGSKRLTTETKLLDTSLGTLSKTLAKIKLDKLDPKNVDKKWADLAESLEKFGLVAKDNPLNIITAEDAALIAEMGANVKALSEAGTELTGSQAMAKNAIDQNGGSVEDAIKQVEEFSKVLDNNAVVLYNLRTAMLAAGMSAETFDKQYSGILANQRAARENAEGALKQLNTQKKADGKGKGSKNDPSDLINRYQELFLSDFEKKVREINETYTKDLKTAGKDAELQSKAEEIYKTNLLRADLEKLKAYGLSIVESVKAKAETVKSIYDFYADVISERLDKFNEINKEIKAAALKTVKVSTNTGGERGLSDEEINVLGKKDALKERQSETLSVLVEGTSEYLAVKKYFAEQSLALDLELTEAGIQAEWAYLSAKSEVYAQLFDLSQSYIEQIWKEGDETQKAVGNVAFGVLALGSTLDGFFNKMKEVNFADMSGLQAGLKTMQIFASSAGALADKVIKSEKAKAVIKGAIQVAEAAAAFATPGGIMQGIAHSAAASLFFAAAGTSGKKAEAKAIEPKRAAALTDRDSQAGRNDRVQQIFQIFVNPITGQNVVGLVNGANQRGQGPQFTSRAIANPNRVTGL